MRGASTSVFSAGTGDPSQMTSRNAENFEGQEQQYRALQLLIVEEGKWFCLK
jgi:hypothetical protein